MIFTIIFATLFPFVVGWWFGKGQIDPDTPEVRVYYNP